MKFIDNYLRRHGFVQAPVQKTAGFMGLESQGYFEGKTDTLKIANYDSFIKAYRSLPWLYAGVTALAVACTKPPLKCYVEKKTEDGVEQIKVEGDDLNRLMELPNDNLSQRELIQITAINLALTGNAYWNLVGTSKREPVEISIKNRPVEIWWVKPEQIEPIVDRFGNVTKYEFTTPTGGKQYMTVSEIIHFRQMNPGSYHLGMGMMEPLTQTATTEFNAMTFQQRYLENDGTPPFIFEHPGEPSPEERKRFWTAWDQRHKGPKNANRAAMVWGGMKVTKLGESMKDAQYTDLRKMNREELLAGIGVPPSVVGLLEYANYSNMEVQQRKFWEDSVIPILGLIADKLSARLAPYFDERIWFEFDYSDIKALQEDSERQARIAETWVRIGAMTPNQVIKEFLNGEPYPGGDVYYVPMGYVPVGGKDYVEPPPVAQPAVSPSTDGKPTADPPLPADPAAPPQDKAIKSASFWRGAEQRKQYWGAYEKRVASKERAMIPAVNKYLRQQANAVKRKLSKVESMEGLRPADLFDIEAETALYVSKFEARYRVAFEDAGEAGYRATRKELWLTDEKAAREFKPTPEQVARLKAQIERAAQFFNSTTWETIKADIEAAKLDGDTIEELTQDLWEHLDNLSVSKARLISRTEMARTENWGGIEGYKQNEFINRKGWMCSFVADSRDDHMKADGDEVGLDEAFNVGGEQMEFPGDESHGATSGNVCNCLCTTYPIVE